MSASSSRILDIERRYQSLDVESLQRIVHVDTSDYQEEAVEAAKRELRRRGAPDQPPDELMQAAEAEQVEQEVADGERLPVPLRIVCGLFAGLPGFLIAMSQGGRGKRREKDAWSSMAIGWLIRIAIAAIGFLGRTR